MRVFSFFIHDRRYSVPTLDFAAARDETLAREMAGRLLQRTEHYLAVDVVEDQTELFSLIRGAVV